MDEERSYSFCISKSNFDILEYMDKNFSKDIFEEEESSAFDIKSYLLDGVMMDLIPLRLDDFITGYIVIVSDYDGDFCRTPEESIKRLPEKLAKRFLFNIDLIS